MTQRACKIPGTQKKNERIRLIATSESHLFFFRKTASGGRMMDKMTKRISLPSAMIDKISPFVNSGSKLEKLILFANWENNYITWKVI